MAEWLKAHAWKACKRLRVSGVRIPPSPLFIYLPIFFNFFFINNSPIFSREMRLNVKYLKLQEETINIFNESTNNIHKYHFKVFIEMMNEKL